MIAAVLAVVVAAGTPLEGASSAPEFRIDTWTTDQGLPSDAVAAVAQTPDGYLWVATNAGLARFDGVRFELFNTRNTPELASNGCGGLFVDGKGSLWVPTTGGGITRFAEGVFTGFGRAEGLTSEHAGLFLQDRSGRMWFGTNSTLHVWDGESFATLGEKERLPTPPPQPVMETADGTVWLYDHQGRLGSWRDGAYRPPNEGVSPIPPSISGPARPWPGRDGTFWVSAAGYPLLTRVHGSETTAFDLDPISKLDHVSVVRETRTGDVWVGMTESGLRLLRDGRVTAITERDGLASAPVKGLTVDREGNLWVATPAGLTRVKPRAFSMLGARDGLTDERVWAVYEDRHGDVWIGTETVLCRLHGGETRCYGLGEGLARGAVSLVEDRSGRLWVGTSRGLSRFSDGSFVTYTVRDGLSNDRVRALYEDRRGRLWIGTSDGGLNVYEDGRFRAYTTKEGLAADWVRYIFEDTAGHLWICTTGGVSRLDDGRITSFTTADGLPDDHVITAHEGADGAIWFGTYRNGLSRYKDGTFANVSAADGLPDDTILHILEDDRDRFWISTSRGIFRVDERALDEFADGRSKRLASVSYGKTDGLATTDCGGGTQPAGWKMRDGRLWFPTSRGVAIVDPAGITMNEVPPPVVLERVTYDGVEAPSRGAAFPAGTRTVELNYSALSFTAPEKVRFRHRLEGFDEDWVEAGTHRATYYTNLPPASYRFRVLAANDDGVWNETGALYEFGIEPYFYQTLGFYAVCAVLAVAAAWSVHRLRLRQTEARYAAVVSERSRIARELHDTIAQGFAGVSMQLEAVSARMDGAPGDARENLDQARQLIRTSLADARRTVRDLRPQLLESRDLATALGALASSLSTAGGVEVALDVRGRRRAIPPLVEDQLFRVAQEALTNAVKHGRPREVGIAIAYDRQRVELTVEDDGCGYESVTPPAARDGGGYGLVGMRERMEQIGGTLEIVSEPGRGTRVRAVVPL